jgi:hypothetical protein
MPQPDRYGNTNQKTNEQSSGATRWREVPTQHRENSTPTICKSLADVNSSTYNSVNRRRSPTGRSFLPASPEGFIAANKRKCGCLGTFKATDKEWDMIEFICYQQSEAQMQAWLGKVRCFKRVERKKERSCCFVSLPCPRLPFRPATRNHPFRPRGYSSVVKSQKKQD